MSFAELAHAVEAVAETIGRRGGDRSGLNAVSAFLRAQGDGKPAAAFKRARKALETGAPLAGPMDVRASAGAAALDDVAALTTALGGKAALAKLAEQTRDFFTEFDAASVETLGGLAAEPPAKPAAKTAAKPRAKKAAAKA